MYPGDSESKWPREVLPDARVDHRWDEPRTAGRWFLEHLNEMKPTRGGDRVFPQQVDAMWDTYLLFDASATWNERPSSVVSWGYTIIRTSEQLKRDFDFVLRTQHATTPR